MLRTRRRQSAMFLAAGLLVGLAIGGALAAGVYLGRQAESGHEAALTELRLKASASHGSDSFAMATGDIADGVEGLFCLDYLTGDLTCFVISPRNGSIMGLFKTNVVTDLPAEKGKKASYVLVTGAFQASGGSYGGSSIASSLVYVADANSGMVAAYAIPWTKQRTAGGVSQAAKMVRVYAGKVRSLEIRE